MTNKIATRPDISLISTRCAICGSEQHAVELYPANFSPRDLSPEVFSARRLPDKIHYRVVRCQTCGLVRSDPILELEALAELYSKSSQTYDSEVPNLMESYARYLDRAVRRLSQSNPDFNKGMLLEIGCGSGFFLEKALEHGFQKVMGVEPSRQAVEKSAPHIRPNIICDILRPGLLPEGQLDLICMFQVFDHIPDPQVVLEECFLMLKPGGGVLCFNHDVDAAFARLLGERSPIIDIEHTYLYNQKTIKRIFTDHGYKVLETDSAVNTYSLHYLIHLFPLPKGLKASLLSSLSKSPLGRVKLPVRLGNLYMVAQKEKGILHARETGHKSF